MCSKMDLRPTNSGYSLMAKKTVGANLSLAC